MQVKNYINHVKKIKPLIDQLKRKNALFDCKIF